MKSVALHNLGCKVNSYEMDFMHQMLLKNGFTIVPFDQYADIYIINTCSVTNIADRKSRQMLHRCKQLNPEAVVVAVGCYVQTDTQRVLEDPNIDIAIGNNNKHMVVEALMDFLAAKEKGEVPTSDYVFDINDKENPCGYEDMEITQTAEHTRAYIKIQDGCNQFCSYCIIPFARGRVRSRKQEEIVEEIKKLSAAGYKEIVLTGIHISSYGVDFKDGSDLISLLEIINSIEGIERIRLGSLEPRIITKDFVDRLVKLDKICPHFHLSLQSGCNSVLKRMNRHYTTEEYKDGVELLREAYDRPAITTDIIAGFPGETVEEFETTAAYMREIGFYEVHLFPYSRRHGTVADKMDGQLTRQEKADRVSKLDVIEKEMSKYYRESFVGENAKVLLEELKEIDGTMYMVGHTDRYIMVAMKSEEELQNTFVELNLTGLLSDAILIGEPC